MNREKHQIFSCQNKSYSVRELLRFLSPSDSILGDLERRIDNIADAENIDGDSLDWIHKDNRDPWKYLCNSKAKVLIVSVEMKDRVKGLLDKKTIILSGNPMLLFIRIATALFTEKPKPGIHTSSVIHPEASIGKDVHIGPLCYIGKCEIGDGCVIHSHVSIENGVKIGNNVLILSGAIIGQEDFTHVMNEYGENEKFPHVGKVIIEDNVEIGASTLVNRGTLSITKIGKGTKIDGQVMVGHNVQIGEHCKVTGKVVLGGSCCLGNGVFIGLGALIRNGVKIGANAFICMGSVVTTNVKEDADVMGYPAEPRSMFKGKKKTVDLLYKEKEKR